MSRVQKLRFAPAAPDRPRKTTAMRNGERPRVSLQFNIENLTNNVYLISKESTFVQGQYYIPRLFSGSLNFRF